MSEEAKWALLACGSLAALIVLLYFRARAHAKFLHGHIDRKIDVVHQKVEDVKVAVEGSRLEAEDATLKARAHAGYLTAMVEGSRKDAAKAVEGMRTALHDSDAAAALEGEKNRSQNKLFQSTFFRHVLEFMKSVVNGKSK